MVAIPLLYRRLTAADYEDTVASDPSIDALREKLRIEEVSEFTRDYHDPGKRSIANGLTLGFLEGKVLEEMVSYPIGHRRRRHGGIPLLEAKFKRNLARRFPARQQEAILKASLDQTTLEDMAVDEYIDLYVI